MVAASQFCIAYVLVDALCLALTVIISSNISRDSGSETQVRTFFMLLTANLVFVVGDATWAILVFSQIFDPPRIVLGIVNGINLTAIAFAGYFWFIFSLAYFGSRVTNSRALRIAMALPALLVIVVHIIGYFTGQNVIFQPDGNITYGFAHTLCSLVPLAYLVAATGVAVRAYRRAETRSQRRMCLAFVSFMLPPAAAGVFDMFVPDTPVAAAGIMLAIVFIMMSLQESRISSDALTGLNNRRRAEEFLETSVSRASAEHPLYLFIIDMDRFKTINDTYGHLEGDHALQLMADVLRNACSQVNAFAARWGGDEFVVISARESTIEPERVSALIQETLANTAHEAHVEYNLACSVGYAKCDSPSETSTELIADADKMLYKVKQEHHAVQ